MLLELFFVTMACFRRAFYENDSEPRMYSPVGEKLVSETSFGSSNCEKKADAVPGNQTKIFNSRKRKKSESSGDPGKL